MKILLTILLFSQYQRLPMPQRREWLDCHCNHVHYEVTLKTDKHGEATIRYKNLYPLDSYKDVPVACFVLRKQGDAIWNVPIYVKDEDREHITIRTKPNLTVPYACDFAVPKIETVKK